MNYASGPDNDPALILIPGQAGTWENYREVLIPLSKKFQVFTVDVRGHGKSDWPTGKYSFKYIGNDFTTFLEYLVKRPAISSVNSSGGLVALWLAANRPKLIKGIVMEDPPLFSADWPRIKTDSDVYRILQTTIEITDVMKTSDRVKVLAKVLTKIERPIEGKEKTRKVPYWMAYILAWRIRRAQKKKKAQIPRSGRIASLVYTLTHYDPDFSRAWVDGRMYDGLNHETAMKQAKCPILLLHANWFRHPRYGLVGAMDDHDAAKARKLAPHMIYKRIDSEHVIHSHNPARFIAEIEEFSTPLD